MNHQALEQKRRIINQKTIIGIDPAKAKHQAVIIDASGMQRGTSFAFAVSVEGYTTKYPPALTCLLYES